MYKIVQIPIPLIPVLYDQIFSQLREAIDRSDGTATIESVYNRAVNGDIWIYTATKGHEIIMVYTLEIIVFESGKRVLSMPFVGGTDMAETKDIIMDSMISIAKQYGCVELRGMSVRKGWLKAVHGWESVHEVIKYKIGDF